MNTQSNQATTDEAILEQFMRETDSLVSASSEISQTVELLTLLKKARGIVAALEN